MSAVASRVRVIVDGRVVAEAAPGTEVAFGRDPANGVELAHPLVSRRHARLIFDSVWVLEDLSSANGTWMAGQPVHRVSLVDVHEARLGDPSDAPLVRFEVINGPAPQVHSPSPMAPPTAPAGTPTFAIGRHAQSDLYLDDPMVSANHARLEFRQGRTWIVDLGSTNQTIVNGQAVLQCVLDEGDKILIGNTHLQFRNGELVRQATGGLVVRNATLAIRTGRRIVNDISFSVTRPSVVAVIGPSGAGKSSLLRLLTGQVRPTLGAVDFRGASMVSQRQAFRGDIGVVPQFTIAHGQLTARQALDYTAQLRFAEDVSIADRAARVAEVLHHLGLTPHADTQVSRLSGGQQRRVSIAMEMLTEPTMLILDEPTSGLDPSLVLQIMQLLRQFADNGKQVLVVTHDLEHLDLVDEVIVLRAGGTIAYAGPPRGVFGHFGRSSWAEVFADLAIPAEASSAPVGLAGVAPTTSFDVPVPPQSTKQILRHARAVASRHLKVMLADPTFVALTLGMPFVLALLALAVPGEHGLSPEVGVGAPDPNPGRLLAILIIGAAFLGLAGAIRELVAERPIYLHERAAGLPPLSYLLAKSLILSAVALFQSLLFVAVVLAVKPDPADGVTVAPPFFEILAAVSATAVSCVMLGLAVSARIGTTEQATPPLVLLVMGQLVLCGGLFPIVGRAGLAQLAWFAPARWGYAAAAATTDLNQIIPPNDQDPRWDHALGPWYLAFSMLGLLTIALWFAAYLGVRRREKFG